jgi:3-oxoadipate enol-lactonase
VPNSDDSRPTVVLLPPIGNDAGTWFSVDLPAEAERHQFPGFGAPPATAPYTLDDLADQVVAEHPGPLHLIGVSMGGMVSLHVALRHPERVASVLIACTGAAASSATMEQRAVAAERGGMAGVLDDTLSRWFTAEALARTPAAPGVEYARRTLLGLDPAAFAAGWRAIGTHDVAARLPELQMPVTAVAGSQDAASPVARSEEIATQVRNGRLVVVDGAPHMIQLENPERMSREIADHLAWAQASTLPGR